MLVISEKRLVYLRGGKVSVLRFSPRFQVTTLAVISSLIGIFAFYILISLQYFRQAKSDARDSVILRNVNDRLSGQISYLINDINTIKEVISVSPLAQERLAYLDNNPNKCQGTDVGNQQVQKYAAGSRIDTMSKLAMTDFTVQKALNSLQYETQVRISKLLATASSAGLDPVKTIGAADKAFKGALSFSLSPVKVFKTLSVRNVSLNSRGVMGSNFDSAALIRKVRYFNSAANFLHKLPTSLPIRGSYRLTSHFGSRLHPIKRRVLFHDGIDIVDDISNDIFATAKGIVKRAKYSKTYGRYVVIDHGQGVETVYAHMSRLLVEDGDTVSEGQVIGYQGNTGSSTSRHLHYEVRYHGIPINPQKLFAINNQKSLD